MRECITTVDLAGGRKLIVHVRKKDAAVPDLSELSREFKGKSESDITAALKRRGLSDLVIREVVRRAMRDAGEQFAVNKSVSTGKFEVVTLGARPTNINPSDKFATRAAAQAEADKRNGAKAHDSNSELIALHNAIKYAKNIGDAAAVKRLQAQLAKLQAAAKTNDCSCQTGQRDEDVMATQAKKYGMTREEYVEWRKIEAKKMSPRFRQLQKEEMAI